VVTYTCLLIAALYILDSTILSRTTFRDLNDWQGAYQIYNTVKVRTMRCDRSPVSITTLVVITVTVCSAVLYCPRPLLS
jgi:hypothetical protein